jgi:PAS domain S-box-containing protein
VSAEECGQDIERRRYHDLFDLAPDAYLVTDLDGIIDEANLSASRLLGYTPRVFSREGSRRLYRHRTIASASDHC